MPQASTAYTLQAQTLQFASRLHFFMIADPANYCSVCHRNYLTGNVTGCVFKASVIVLVRFIVLDGFLPEHGMFFMAFGRAKRYWLGPESSGADAGAGIYLRWVYASKC